MLSPYKGLVPYSEDDAPFFFGRAAEQEIIVANMNVSRLTLLYGASGVGKSSILRAGITHQLRRDAQRNLAERGTPEFGVVVFSSWRDDPVQALIARVEDETARTLGTDVETLQRVQFTRRDVSIGAVPSLADALAAFAQRVGGDLYIILDQFEEYFLYHPDDSGEGSFAHEFARVLNREDLRVNFLLAIREDALAKLDRFKGRVPSLFDNYLRMEHLDRSAAREAIVKPLDEFNRLYANGSRVEIEPALVDAVLEQTRTGQVIVGESGRGAVERAVGDEIETPYLQLVMTRLWAETFGSAEPVGVGSSLPPSVLRLETLERLGGAEKIVRTHLDTTMSSLTPQEQGVSANIFNFLVTPSGTKIAHTARDLADYSHVPQSEIAATLEKLSGGDIRILRPVAPPLDQPDEPRYEIFHDVLGAPILDWRARFVQGQEKIESDRKLAAEKRRVRRLRFGLVGLSLLLLAVIALALFALTQREAAARASADAEQQKAEALNQRDAAQKAQADALAQKILAEQEKQNAEAAKLDAEQQQKIARSGELAALSLGQLAADPERALLMAREAVRAAQTAQAEDALRTALLDPYRLTFRGRGDPIKDARFTPDGRYAITLEPCAQSSIATITCGSVRIWDTQTGNLVTDLQMPAAASKMDISSDGKYIATANADAVARVWEIPSGKLVSELRGHQGKINDVHFSPDGTQVVTASDDKTARVWNPKDGSMVHELGDQRTGVDAAKFSPDGIYVVTTGVVGGKVPGGAVLGDVVIWDARSGARVMQIQNVGASALELSPDSRFLTAWREDDNTYPSVWTIDSGNKIAELASSGNNLSLTSSPDGKYILTGDNEGNLRVYDALVGRNTATLVAHNKGVRDVKFSPNGQFAATVGGDNRARWWLFRGQRLSSTEYLGPPAESPLDLLQDLNGHTLPINSVAFGPDGQSILTSSDDGTARLWHVDAGEALEGHTKFVTHAVFSPDGKRVATASRDGTTRVWDASTRQTLFTLPVDAAKILQYSPDGKQLLTVTDNGALQVWDSQTGARVWEFKNSDGVLRAAFSPDNLRVAAFSSDGKLRLWDAATGGQVAEQQLLSQDSMTVFNPQFAWLAYSPDGTRGALAVGGEGPYQFDAQTGEILPRWVGAVPWNALLTYSPDGKQLAIAYSNTTTSAGIEQSGGFQVWDVATRKLVRNVRGVLPRTISFSPDGKLILTTTGDHYARVWDAASGKLLHELTGHTDTVSRAAFSPDGRFIVTAGNDKTARLWETATGKLVETLYGHSDILTGAAFSPDGKTILTAGDNTARLYECLACASPEDLMQLANARVTRELTCEERVTFLRQEMQCANP